MLGSATQLEGVEFGAGKSPLSTCAEQLKGVAASRRMYPASAFENFSQPRVIEIWLPARLNRPDEAVEPRPSHFICSGRAGSVLLLWERGIGDAPRRYLYVLYPAMTPHRRRPRILRGPRIGVAAVAALTGDPAMVTSASEACNCHLPRHNAG